MATVDYARLVPKGWALYDQTGTPAVDGSENVSSVTDNAAGQFTVNWGDNFDSDNYVCVAMTNDEATQFTAMYESGAGTNHLAGSIKLLSVNLGSVTVDRTSNNVVAFGSLA